jgi:hypothetical protein
MRTFVLAALLSGVTAASAFAYAPSVPSFAERAASAPSVSFPDIGVSRSIAAEALIAGESALLPAEIRRRIDALQAVCAAVASRGPAPSFCLGYLTRVAEAGPAVPSPPS